MSRIDNKGLHHGYKQCSICRQTTNYSKTTKSVLTQIYIKQNIHKHRTQNIFEELVRLVPPLLKKKKHIRLGHAGIVDHSVDLSIPDFLKRYKKGMDRGNKKFKKYFINA